MTMMMVARGATGRPTSHRWYVPSLLGRHGARSNADGDGLLDWQRLVVDYDDDGALRLVHGQNRLGRERWGQVNVQGRSPTEAVVECGRCHALRGAAVHEIVKLELVDLLADHLCLDEREEAAALRLERREHDGTEGVAVVLVVQL